VVDVEPHGGFVVADIPGLIEGAARGAGLGIRFLRHIERTRLLVHVVDVSDDAADPVAAVETVEQELHAYNPGLLSLPRIVAANKIDLPHAAALTRLAGRCKAQGTPMVAVSALTGDGIPALLDALATRLQASQGKLHDLPQSRVLR
jgi:GTP-binding protein